MHRNFFALSKLYGFECYVFRAIHKACFGKTINCKFQLELHFFSQLLFQKLEAAQNALFCRELFAQLAKEAIILQAPIPHMVVGNQITASLFPDIQVLLNDDEHFCLQHFRRHTCKRQVRRVN